MANEYSQYTFDAELLLKDTGALTASADSLILDLGDGIIDQLAVIDVTAIKTSAGDEKYTISVEASNTADMSAGSVAVATKVVGLLTAPMDADATEAGRYVIPFRNEENGNIYRYVRLSVVIAGTLPSIDFLAFVGTRA